MKTTNFGRQLRAVRARLGITQKQLSEELHYTAAYLSSIESGKRSVPKDFINIIGSIYGLPDEELNELKEAQKKDRQLETEETENIENYKERLCAEIRKKKLNADECDELFNLIKKI